MSTQNGKSVRHPTRPAAAGQALPVQPHRHHLDDLDSDPVADDGAEDPVHLPHARAGHPPPSDPALCLGAVRHVLRDRGILAVLIEGDGATDMVARLLTLLGATPVAVIAGPGLDPGADLPAARVAGALDARAVEAAMDDLPLLPASLLFVLSAVATPDLGQDLRIEAGLPVAGSDEALLHRLMLGLAGKAR